MTISFFLKKPAKKNGERGVFAYTRFGKDQMIIYFPHLSVKPTEWSQKKQRVKPSVTNAAPINDALSKIESDLKGIIASLLKEHIQPTPELVKSRFKALRKTDATRTGEKSFLEFFQDWIDQSRNSKTEQTLKLYGSVKARLEEYQEDRGAKLTFERMDREFVNSFTDYLIRIKKLQNSTVWHNVKTWKAFMNWAVKIGLTTNREFERITKKDFNVQEPMIVRLTEEEFNRFTDYDFTGSPYLNNARNLFILQASIGVRVSDLLKIVQAPAFYIEGDSIRIVAQKTRKEQRIPLNPRARRILFSANPPHHISDVKLNKYIKEAAKVAGLDRVVTKSEFRGTNRTDISVPLHDEISTHCAKRTFVSLMVASGVHIQTIADITGNTLETIQRYISLDEGELRREAKKAESVFS